MTRICLWSGPRNISTALMYAFAQREDTTVFDEPLYAHYLSKTTAKEYHPGAEEIISTMENDGEKVVEMMLGSHSTPVVFFKHMTHHLIELKMDFLKYVVNIILTRDPLDMLPSYVQQVATPSLRDVGYKAHVDLVEFLKSQNQMYFILDSKNLLLDPPSVLSKLCEAIGIPFDESMLSWPAGARPEDGCWAKYWYHNVHKSTGFAPYRAKTEVFPESLLPLLEVCQPLYEQLAKKAIK